ncbi:MAG: hypothetical protein HDR21_04180 [Lachnospiraceae bacterium]|nr:hypothetical protein [Lachnospiraceae bacterium]
MKDHLVEWLLEEKKPEVRLRTQVELLKADREETEKAINLVKNTKTFDKNMALLNEKKPWSVCYGLTAFAEWGLTRNEVDIDEYVDWIIENTGFAIHCGEGMLLRSLVKLGYGDDKRVENEMKTIFTGLNTDGGFQCISDNKKINDPKRSHKSCYRLTATYLLLLAELKLHGISLPCEQRFAEYFLKRDVLFRTDNMDEVVVSGCHNTYFPTDCISHGIQEIVYAMSVLGYGNRPECKRAWDFAQQHMLENGKYILTARSSKPYFSIGVKGKENKWITLYMLLAEKYKDGRYQ